MLRGRRGGGEEKVDAVVKEGSLWMGEGGGRCWLSVI